MASLGRGGLQFILIIWLQGIWLPQHGYSFDRTPLWAGIYMLPLTIGFLLAAPAAGFLSDKVGTRWFAAFGLLITAVTFVLLIILPVNFNYWPFAGILVLNGLGMGLFAAPNRAEVMNSLPGNARGSGAGMMTTFQNSAMVLSIGIFFSLIIAGLSRNLPSAMSSGLAAHGVPAGQADQLAHLPAVAVLFAAFLGYNPIQQLLGNHLGSISPNQAHFLTGRSFFPHLISAPFADGLTVAFIFAIVACVIGAVASFLCGPQRKSAEPVGVELAGVAAESGEMPAELVAPTVAEPVRPPQPLNGAARHRVTDDPTTVLSGRIVDGAGRPVEGAVLTVLAAPLAGSLRTVTEPSGRQVRHTKVGDDGQYAFTDLPSGSYTLIVSAPGYTPQAAAATLDHREQQDFTLVGAGAISGTVNPAAATVVLTDAAGEVVAATRSGTDGSYRFTGLPGGVLTVTAQASGYRPAVAPIEVGSGAGADLELELSPIGGLAGIVRAPDGRPLRDVTISVIATDGEIQGRGRTDDHGRYEIEGLASGEYTVVASYFDTGTAAVSLEGKHENVDVVLTDAGLVSSASDAG
jgi:MFS family permease